MLIETDASSYDPQVDSRTAPPVSSNNAEEVQKPSALTERDVEMSDRTRGQQIHPRATAAGPPMRTFSPTPFPSVGESGYRGQDGVEVYEIEDDMEYDNEVSGSNQMDARQKGNTPQHSMDFQTEQEDNEDASFDG